MGCGLSPFLRPTRFLISLGGIEWASFYYASAPIGWGHYAMMTVVCLSVCLSVPCLTQTPERKGIAR